MRFTFNVRDDELPLILGLRPILKKSQWEGRDFAASGTGIIPVSSAPYVISDFEPGRYVVLTRNPDYWGYGVVPYRRGTANLDEIRMEFFADGTAMFEAFKGGLLTTSRETSVQKWNSQYNFPAIQSGDVVKSYIPHKRPSGIRGPRDEHAATAASGLAGTRGADHGIQLRIHQPDDQWRATAPHHVLLFKLDPWHEQRACRRPRSGIPRALCNGTPARRARRLRASRRRRHGAESKEPEGPHCLSWAKPAGRSGTAS